MTQLDYWTYLVDLIQPSQLAELESGENRLILKNLRESHLRLDDPCKNKDIIIMALNSIIEFIFEGFKKDVQIANMLAKTTKLLSHVFDTLKYVIDSYNAETLTLLLVSNSASSASGAAPVAAAVVKREGFVDNFTRKHHAGPSEQEGCDLRKTQAKLCNKGQSCSEQGTCSE